MHWRRTLEEQNGTEGEVKSRRGKEEKGVYKAIKSTRWFWPRVRARTLRAPILLALCHAKRGTVRPRTLQLHIQRPKNINLLFLSGPSSGRQGRISFHWTTHRTLLSYSAPSKI
jgi:hypothetical protein